MSKKQLSFETDLIKKVLKCNYDTASLDGRSVQEEEPEGSVQSKCMTLFLRMKIIFFFK